MTVKWGGSLIVAAGLAAYANSLRGPFVFDDPSSITANPTIRHLWPLWPVLRTPHVSVTAAERPLLNLSLAINYAFGQNHVLGYHLLNVGIHLAAGLVLFGIIRRTLLKLGVAPALPLALAAALLWTVHPLQTEAVTYTVQRAESMMGLFYLLTLYCFIREWYVLSVLACLCGAGSKEVIASAPVIVLVFDVIFCTRDLAETFRRRWGYYLGLGATWILLLLLLIAGGGNRSGSVGFGVHVAWINYFLTQFQAIGTYLKLAFWPHPLVFEYGIFWVHSAGQVLPWACLVVPPLVLTVVALVRWPAWGFLGLCFFAFLAPTSLIPGTSQMIVEHRMYLSLAAVIIAVVVGGHRLFGRWGVLWLGAAFAAVPACVALTAVRNADYHSALGLWTKTVRERPLNPLARSMLGQVLSNEGKTEAALEQFTESADLDPTFPLARESMGEMLFKLGRRQEAIACYREAVRLWPDYADANDNLGMALAEQGEMKDGIAFVRKALSVYPEYTEAHYNLAGILDALGRHDEAVQEYLQALRIDPDYEPAQFNLANTLVRLGRPQEAYPHYQAALRIRPDNPKAEYNFANALALAGHPEEALAHYAAAVRLKPDFAAAEGNWGGALLELRRFDEGEAHLRAALRLDPSLVEARMSLERLQAYRAQMRAKQ